MTGWPAAKESGGREDEVEDDEDAKAATLETPGRGDDGTTPVRLVYDKESGFRAERIGGIRERVAAGVTRQELRLKKGDEDGGEELVYEMHRPAMLRLPGVILDGDGPDAVAVASMLVDFGGNVQHRTPARGEEVEAAEDTFVRAGGRGGTTKRASNRRRGAADGEGRDA